MQEELSLNITTCVEGEYGVVKMDGYLVSAYSDQIKQAMNDIMVDKDNLILDFEKVIFMASVGIHIILVANQKTEEKSGKMIIRNPNETVLDVLKAAGLIKYFTIECNHN